MTENMASEELKNLLLNLEIPELQAKIYLALLGLGKANYTELSKATKIKRTTLYNLIEKMENRGLVKRGLDKNRFEPIHPHQVFDSLQKNNLAFYHALPLFQSLINQTGDITKVKFYNSTKGIQQLFLDELGAYKKKKEKILRTVGVGAFYKMDTDFKDQYLKLRQSTGITTRVIGSPDLKKYQTEYQHHFANWTVKYLPEGAGSFSARISVSPARVSIIGFLKDNSGIMIESQEIADTFIKLFDYIWKTL
jgi:predicted transcriptional regulator